MQNLMSQAFRAQLTGGVSELELTLAWRLRAHALLTELRTGYILRSCGGYTQRRTLLL